ncbi:MAG: hypothetical protein J6B91_03005 [Prevotella sp.]|nr:hypothetical protein [Prevotella sp.]
MKSIKLFIMAAILPLLASCLDNDETNSGFSAVGGSSGYANTTNGYIQFASLGNWYIVQDASTDWLKIDLMKGDGYSLYFIPTHFSQNTTGNMRMARIRIQDANESDAYTMFSIGQYATRGDGSLGNAPLVKTITCDDGAEFNITYDDKCRPNIFSMNRDGALVYDMSFDYNDSDTTLYVYSGSNTLEGRFDVGYQPDQLTSRNDSVTCRNSVYANSIAIMVERRLAGGEQYGVSQLFAGGQRFGADDEHVADSLKYRHIYSDGRQTYGEDLKLYFGEENTKVSNRNQSVDVNQLLLGMEECNPYMLLSLFRNMRNSYVITKAAGKDGDYTVATTLNPDKSVSTMTVTDKNGNKKTYTFGY